MAKNIQTASTTGPQATRPPYSGRDVSLSSAVAINGRAHELLPVHVQAIHDRAGLLRQSLAGGNRKALAEIVSGLLRVFPRRDGGTEDAMQLVSGYVAALEPLPVWAVQEAAGGWLRGDHGPQRWAPTPPEIAAKAKGFCDPYWQELGRLEAAIRAIGGQAPACAPERPSDPDERSRVAAGFDGLLRELTAAKDMSGEALRREEREREKRRGEERRVRECEAAGIDPSMGISVALARNLAARR